MIPFLNLRAVLAISLGDQNGFSNEAFQKSDLVIALVHSRSIPGFEMMVVLKSLNPTSM